MYKWSVKHHLDVGKRHPEQVVAPTQVSPSSALNSHETNLMNFWGHSAPWFNPAGRRSSHFPRSLSIS